MNRKVLSVVVVLMLVAAAVMFGQTRNTDTANFVASAYSIKTFTTAPVDQKDLDLVLKAGIQAPSARNLQPWRFTVVKDLDTMKKLIPDCVAGNVLIIVSGQEQADKDKAAAIALDCGLAVQNMYLAAQALGLGSHLYTGPIANLNAKYRDLVPTGFVGVAIVKIGSVARTADAVSGASTRKAGSEIVNYR
jgi:nitroreductase